MAVQQKPLSVLLFLAVLSSAACSGSTRPTKELQTEPDGSKRDGVNIVIGGSCEYEEVAGTCVVQSLSDDQSPDVSCAFKRVRFMFVPDDPDAELKFGRRSHEGELTVDGVHGPSVAWLEEKGITEGTELSCVRKAIKSGTCSPVVWTFALDLSSGLCLR